MYVCMCAKKEERKEERKKKEETYEKKKKNNNNTADLGKYASRTMRAQCVEKNV